MSEKPILFSGEMVRAILGGRKTQTRRVIKCPPDSLRIADKMIEHLIVEGCWYVWLPIGYSPYGQAGDLLWVREAWALTDLEFPKVAYKANGDWATITRWKPSIYMPRWASRLALQIKSVRVERVQDISSTDALNEGIQKIHDSCAWTYGYNGMPVPAFYGKPEYAFRALWDSINAKRGYGWDVNPWVWAITFERVE